MATDRYPGKFNTIEGPADNAANVSVGALSNVSRALWVGSTGDLVVITKGGEEVYFRNIPDGTFLPVRVREILASTSDSPQTCDTSASDIVALW